MKNSFFFIITILIIFSCKQENRALHDALTVAGDNRQELEKVLNHYSQHPGDSLKYKAACFLIEHMPYHYSYKDTASINKYYHQLDSVATIYKYQKESVKDSLFRHIKNQYTPTMRYVSDIHVLTGDYLIDNIERAFDVWQNGEWSLHIGFDDFCEYILPYKVCEGQILDNWREYFYDYCDGPIKNHRYAKLLQNAAYNACDRVNRDLRDSIRPRMIPENHIPVRKMNTLTQIPFGSCDDYNTVALALLRAKGIPTIMDFTPQWPFRSMGHSWNVLIETSGKKIVYEGAGDRPASPHKEEHPMAKAFRKTYTVNNDLVKIRAAEKYIPPTFQEVCMTDVSGEYFDHRNIQVKTPASHGHKYAYLAVFDNAGWIPVHYGEIKRNKVIFDKMGKRIVYLPVFYKSNGINAFADPILLTISGEQIILTPDTLKKQTLSLKRKYACFENLYEISERVVGGRFQTGTDSLFTDSLTQHTITELGIFAREVDFTHIQDSARYWRYYPPDGAHCNMAELLFYEKDSVRPTMGKIIGSEGSFREGKKYTKEAVFDGDALTFFDASERNGAWVGLDFGKPVKIDKIIYLPRSDGNCIEPGDEYELLYWGNNNWQSMGRKIADHIILTYDDCPTNALFLLRNHTKGKEERIFTYENDEQVWW